MMKNFKTYVLTAALLGAVNLVSAQTEQRSNSGEEVFLAVDQTPQYVDNGMDGLAKFLGKNLNYPKDARKNNVQGNVYVTFIVEKDGSISDVGVAKGVEKSLDDEAVRVIKLTKWKPGQQNGKIVRTKLVVPISYKI